LGIIGLLLVPLAGCSKSGGAKTKEFPITGKPSDAPVDLKARWQPGKRYVIRMELTRGSEVRRANQRQPLPREDRLAQEVAITVTNGPQGNLGLELELLALELEIVQGERTLVQYATHNEVVSATGNPAIESLEKLIGGRLYYLLSPENKVLRMEGMKEFMERAEGRAPSSTAVGKPPQPRRTSTVRSYYNPDSLRAILDLSGMPDKPVRIGDSWPVQREAGPTPGPGGALIVNATYTLKGWQEHEQKRCARIDITGTLAPKTGNTPARQGVSSPLEKSKVTGQCWLDPVLEFPIETALDQSYTVNSVVAQLRQGTNAPVQTRQGTNSPPQGQGTNVPPQKVSSSARQTLSIKLVEVTTL
jgi:hypothetical protein